MVQDFNAPITPSPRTPWNPRETPYPVTRRSDHVDVYNSAKEGSVKIPDPYNWLEGKTEEVDEWVEGEQASYISNMYVCVHVVGRALTREVDVYSPGELYPTTHQQKPE